MKKRVILSEAQLHSVINEAVKRILKEGTSNFGSPINADKIYAVGMDDEEDFSPEFLSEEIAGVDERFTPTLKWSREFRRDVMIVSDGRIGKFNVEILLHPGYYQGAMLDFDIEIDGYRLSEYDTIDDFVEEYNEYYPDYAINSQDVEAVKKEMNSLLAKVATKKLGVIGRFSNGETVYTEID